ncbi:MAG: hypothetical protein ABII88_04170 [Candidatus Omnitrophota bacterium]
MKTLKKINIFLLSITFLFMWAQNVSSCEQTRYADIFTEKDIISYNGGSTEIDVYVFDIEEDWYVAGATVDLECFKKVGEEVTWVVFASGVTEYDYEGGEFGLHHTTLTFENPSSYGIHEQVISAKELEGGDYSSARIDCYEVKIIDPTEYPIYVGSNTTVSLYATNYAGSHEDYEGEFTWSKVSGSGELSMDVIQNGNFSCLTFSTNTGGTYKLEVTFSGPKMNGSDETGDIYVVQAEFLKEGTSTPISEAHVGTDGNSATTLDGETKQIDIKITPSNITVDFDLSNGEVAITPTSGSGTTTVTITGKGSGYSDSEIIVKKDDMGLGSLDVQVHKPDKLVYQYSNSLSAAPGDVGAGNMYVFDVKDIQNRVIPNIGGYRVYERMHIDRNEDGLEGYFYSNLIAKLDCNPYDGIVLPDTEMFNDTLQLWIPDYTTTSDLSADGIVQLHNSWYFMDIYLKSSTYQYTWTPIIQGTAVTGLQMSRSLLSDSQKVTEANDDID